MTQWNYPSTITTTDTARGIPLYLRRDGDMLYVSDMVGLRYGAGDTIAEALAMWAECVQMALDEDPGKVAGPYGAECARYRKALEPRDQRPPQSPGFRREEGE